MKTRQALGGREPRSGAEHREEGRGGVKRDAMGVSPEGPFYAKMVAVDRMSNNNESKSIVTFRDKLVVVEDPSTGQKSSVIVICEKNGTIVLADAEADMPAFVKRCAIEGYPTDMAILAAIESVLGGRRTLVSVSERGVELTFSALAGLKKMPVDIFDDNYLGVVKIVRWCSAWTSATSATSSAATTKATCSGSSRIYFEPALLRQPIRVRLFVLQAHGRRRHRHLGRDGRSDGREPSKSSTRTPHFWMKSFSSPIRASAWRGRSSWTRSSSTRFQPRLPSSNTATTSATDQPGVQASGPGPCGRARHKQEPRSHRARSQQNERKRGRTCRSPRAQGTQGGRPLGGPPLRP